MATQNHEEREYSSNEINWQFKPYLVQTQGDFLTMLKGSFDRIWQAFPKMQEYVTGKGKGDFLTDLMGQEVKICGKYYTLLIFSTANIGHTL